MEISLRIKTEKYKIKEAKSYPSMNNARVLIPKKWDNENVFVISLGDSYNMCLENGENVFEFKLNGEVLIREVKEDKLGKRYIYLPIRFADKKILIIPF